jgi:ketosteroid isomerase-like protein
MSQENVEIVRRWTDAHNRRDSEALIELADPDFVRSRGEGFPDAIFESIEESHARFEVVPEEFLDAGAAVVMIGHLDARKRGSGAEEKVPFASAYWLRAGKVFRIETFEDRSEALEAVWREQNAHADS